MKVLYKLILCYLCFFSFSVNAYACNFFNSEMVILGANCDENLQSGVALYVDPFESKFVTMVESGECSGIVYDDEPMPECAADQIMSNDPTSSYFIHQYLGETNEYNPYDQYNPSDYIYGGTLETITVEVEPGNNPFSIPWNWLVKLSGFADEEVYKEVYDLNDLPSCDPNNLSNKYDSYSEIT